VRILKKTVDAICDNYAGRLRWYGPYGHQLKSEQIDGILPQGLLMLTLRLAVGIDGDQGKGTYAGEVCGVTLSLVACGQ
jgi:hypothetical protein